LTPDGKIRLDVVAGILSDDQGCVLITERVGGGPFQGMWEFPGGKIAAGETAEFALIRELHEEIGIEVLDCASFMYLEHDYPDRFVRLNFFNVVHWSGEAVGLEGQQLKWVSPAEIDIDSMLPADAPVIEALVKMKKWSQ